VPHWRWQDHREWIEILIRQAGIRGRRAILDNVLSHPDSKYNPEWVESLIQWQRFSDGEIDHEILSKPHWKHHQKLRALVDGKVPTAKGLREAFQMGRRLKGNPPSVVTQKSLIRKCVDFFWGWRN
jgi:hypothetical protein